MKVAKISILLCLLCCFAQAQNNTPPIPEQTPLPIAMAAHPTWVTLLLSPNEEYLTAYSENEVRVWHMPDGELRYRYQSGMSWKNGNYETDAMVACKPVGKVQYTPDSKYLTISGVMCGTGFFEAVDLSTGEPLKASPKYDFLKFADKRTYLPEIFPALRYDVLKSSYELFVARDYNRSYFEDIEQLYIIADPNNADRVLVFFRQYYYGSKAWRKKVAAPALDMKPERLNSDLDKGYHLDLHDYHIASVGKTTRDVKFIGTFREGIGGVDFPDEFDLNISADGTYIAYTIDEKKTRWEVALTRSATKWRTPEDKKVSFLSFGDNGTAWFSEFKDNVRSNVRRDLATGTVLDEIKLPVLQTSTNGNEYSQLEKYLWVPKWGMLAVLRPTGTGMLNTDHSTLALHNINTGKVMLPLIDADAAEAFSKSSGEAAARFKAEKEERIKAYYASLEEWRKREEGINEQSAKAQKAQYARDAAAAANHSMNWQTCPKCNGEKGEWYYTPTSTRKKTYSGTLYDEYTVTTSSSKYGKWINCTKCWGKGEIRK